MTLSPAQERSDEWLWGWDPTPHIVSVWATPDGRATVWRRPPEAGVLLREDERFRPWMLLARLDDLAHLGTSLAPEGDPSGRFWWRELDGPGELRFLVSATDLRALTTAVLRGASQRVGRRLGHLRDLGDDAVLSLPPERKCPRVASIRSLWS